jgi:hypothetical protein
MIRFATVAWAVVWTAAVTAASFAAEVRIETTAGKVFSGTWDGNSDTAITVVVDGESRQIPLEQLISLTPVSEVPIGDGPPTEVTLIDQTTIKAQQQALADETLRIEPPGQSAIELPIDRVRSIRFRRGTATTDPQWLGLLEKDQRSDVMVIRRGNEQLDPIEGVVVGMDAQTLKFELDGDPIDAPLDRLEGVLFRTTRTDTSRPTVKVIDRNGSIFLASRLEPTERGDAVELMLPGSVPHVIPLDQIDRITWASGRLMLAQESPAEAGYRPMIRTRLSDELLQRWFSPSAEGDDLVADAGGFVEFRVDEGFQTLAGSVLRDPDVAQRGNTRVRILVDGEVRWEQAIDDDSPKGFSISVADARRVRLEVDSGGDGDVGDRVRFKKPRLLK